MSGDTLARSDTLVNAKWQGKQGYFFSEEEGSRTALLSVFILAWEEVVTESADSTDQERIPLYARAIKNELA